MKVNVHFKVVFAVCLAFGETESSSDRLVDVEDISGGVVPAVGVDLDGPVWGAADAG